LGSRQERHTEQRLSEALQALVTIETSDLALIRGSYHFEGLAIRRDDSVGHLAIDVAGVRCELAPLGLALIDHECSELAIRGAQAEVSSLALFKLAHPKRRPIHTDRLVIDDATFALSLPGADRITIRIEHAESGPTTLRTSLSWLFSARELRATLELPNKLGVRLSVGQGRLAVAGTLFGVTPVIVPFEMPDPRTARDAKEEMELLVDAAKHLGEQLVAQRARDWLRSKL
jgi:hypothetical protein